MRTIVHEPTTSEKIMDAAHNVADLAAEKALEAKKKAEKDVLPALADKTEDVRGAIAPHVETVADKTADQRAAAADKVSNAKAGLAARVAAAAAAAEKARKEAEKKSAKAQKQADKKASKLSKKADKKADKLSKKADEKSGSLFAAFADKKGDVEKKAVRQYGAGPRQDVAYKAAALRGQAQAVAEDKGVTPDHIRDMFNDEFVPHIKELLAAAAAAGTAASQNAVSRLPEGAQKQVAEYAPALAPKKKKGRGMIVLGLAALGAAGYLLYTDQQKKRAHDAQLSEASIADSTAARGDEMTINNPVTNFEKADDTTVVRPAGTDVHTSEPAGGPGTAATWTDAEVSGHTDTAALEGQHETRSARHAARDDH